MAKAECIINIMEENDYIIIKEDTKYSTDKVPAYKIEVSNKIHSSDVKEEINGIMNAVIRENPDKYLIVMEFVKGDIRSFCYKEDVESLVTNFIATNNETIFVKELTYNIRQWIRNHYDFIDAQPGGCGKTVLYNLKIREEREEREEREDAKALDLLYSIL